MNVVLENNLKDFMNESDKKDIVLQATMCNS